MKKKSFDSKVKHVPEVSKKAKPLQSHTKRSSLFVVETRSERRSTLRSYEKQRAEIRSIFD